MRPFLPAALAFVLASVSHIATAQNLKPATLIFGIQADQGDDRLVDKVVPGSPAERAGLQVGDELLMLGTKSTDGMSGTAIIRELSYMDEADLSIGRDGVQKRIHMEKEPWAATGRTCVSGNCVNGHGRTRLINWDNKEYEGTFVNGAMKGQGKIYASDGALLYEGEIGHMLPWGKGRSYGRDAAGRSYLKEEGSYKDLLTEGTQYAEDGSIKAKGKYLHYDREAQLWVGSLAMVYRGKKAVAEIELAEWKDSKPQYQGRVVVFEGTIGHTGKALSDAQYRVGKREGESREWDREAGYLHLINFSAGVPSHNEGNIAKDVDKRASIIRLADTTYVARGVRYAADTKVEEDMIYKILEGFFRFDGKYKYIYSPGGERIPFIKNVYAKLPDTPPAAAFTGSSYSGSGTGSSSGSAYQNDVVAECDGVIRENLRRFSDAASIYNNADLDKGYRTSRINYTNLQQEIIADCDRAIDIYKDRVPSDRIAKLREIRDALSSHNLGSGLFMSMPVQYDGGR